MSAIQVATKFVARVQRYFERIIQGERIYLLAHPDSAKRIHLASSSEPQPPYRLTCICTAERCFGSAETLPFRVSELTCNRGYAERDEYEAIPIQKFPVTRAS